MTQARARVSFREVFGIPEFRAMWFAELLSIAGDQLARVALSIMVFTGTGSTALTGLTYALTYAPSLVGGILLTGIADRLPRRTVMVGVDVLRAVLILGVAIPGLPFWSLCVLVGSVSLLTPVFKAAQIALLPDVLAGDRYPVGMAIRQMTIQSAQLLGFGGGGLLLAVLSPQTALALDAVTFAASALLVRFGLRARPAAAARDQSRTRWAAGFGLAFADRGLLMLLLLCWVMAGLTVYEALAAPYVHGLGGGSAAVGLLLTGDPLGSVIGAYVFGRWVPADLRPRLVGPLAVLAAAVLGLCLLAPGLLGSYVLFVVSGALGSIVVMQATISLTLAVPDTSRGQLIGLSNTGLNTVSGVSPLLAGVVAEGLGAGATIAWFGIAIAAITVPLAVSWHRVTRAEPGRFTPRDEPNTP